MNFKMAVSSNAVLIIAVIVFIATTIVFFILYINGLSNRVSPTQCPKISGNYGATFNVALADIKPQYLCTANPDGTLGSNVCSFTGVDNLFAAQGICSLYSNDVCGGFFYNTNTKSMTFIATGYTFKSSSITDFNNGDIYVLQN